MSARSEKPHGRGAPVPTYVARYDEDEWAWLTAPERGQHIYESSLSTPGRICHTPYCLEFVAGPPDRACPRCGNPNQEVRKTRKKK